MSVGLTLTKADLDNRAASLALGLRTTFEQIKVFKTTLDTLTNADLQGKGYAISPDEAAILKSSFVDLDQLRTVYEGTGTRTPAYDYRTFAKLLTGCI